MRCPYCPRTFILSYSLSQHVAREHSATPAYATPTPTPFMSPFDLGGGFSTPVAPYDDSQPVIPIADPFAGFGGGSSDGGGASASWDGGAGSSASVADSTGCSATDSAIDSSSIYDSSSICSSSTDSGSSGDSASW